MGREGGGWAGPRPARPDVAAGPAREVEREREVTPLATLPLRGLAFRLGCRVRSDPRVLWASPQLWGL